MKLEEYNSKTEEFSETGNKSCIAAQECPAPQEGDNVRRTLTNKVCRYCKQMQPIFEFYPRSDGRGDGYRGKCKTCYKTYYSDTRDRQIAQAKRWNKENKERYAQNCKRHKSENPQKYTQYKRQEYARHVEKYRENAKAYRASKKGKGIRQALGRERSLRKSAATPPWLTKDHRKEMQLIYINRPQGHHVDHIIPLKGKNVCGLHVPWNLQYLPAAENIRKRNKIL